MAPCCRRDGTTIDCLLQTSLGARRQSLAQLGLLRSQVFLSLLPISHRTDMSCQPLAAIFTLQPPKKEIIPRQLGRSKLLRRFCFSPTTINNQQPLTKTDPNYTGKLSINNAVLDSIIHAGRCIRHTCSCKMWSGCRRARPCNASSERASTRLAEAPVADQSSSARTNTG